MELLVELEDTLLLEDITDLWLLEVLLLMVDHLLEEATQLEDKALLMEVLLVLLPMLLEVYLLPVVDM
jgi:hypothetical protein